MVTVVITAMVTRSGSVDGSGGGFGVFVNGAVGDGSNDCRDRLLLLTPILCHDTVMTKLLLLWILLLLL